MVVKLIWLYEQNVFRLVIASCTCWVSNFYPNMLNITYLLKSLDGYSFHSRQRAASNLVHTFFLFQRMFYQNNLKSILNSTLKP